MVPVTSHVRYDPASEITTVVRLLHWKMKKSKSNRNHERNHHLPKLMFVRIKQSLY